MATVDTFKSRVYRMLNDEDEAGYTDALIVDSIQAAQVAILPWMPKLAKDTLSSGNTVLSLPTDFYAVEAVVVQSTGELLPQAVFAPGNTHGENIAATNDWIEYPTGSITFSKELDEDYDLYYLASYTEITTSTAGTFELEPPEQAEAGMLFYATAYAMLPSAVSTAEIRQFGTRVDSGNPEHNPLRDSANYLFKLFREEMNRHPKHQRAQR